MRRPSRILLAFLVLSLSANLAAQPAAETPDGAPAVEARPVAAPDAADPSAATGSADQGEDEAELSVSAALERARSYYQSGAYDSCVDSYQELFEQLDDPAEQVPSKALEQARVYFAACLLAQGRESDADRQLRQAMQENPLMASPDPVVFPAQVRDLFFKVKADFLELIRKAQEEQLRAAREEERQRQEQALAERRRVRQLELLASQEVLVHENQRWIAALPFGVGQFQNGDDVLGGVFLVGELGLLAAAVTSAAVQLHVHHEAGGGSNVIQGSKFNDPLDTAYRVFLWSGAGFVLVAGLGILEAQVNFIDEIPVGTRKRRQSPPARSVLPEVSAVEGGALFGVRGTF